MSELQMIGKKIISLPGRPLFMLDRDVAELYETETRVVNQAVKRNPERFPEDFCFQLDVDETKKVITKCDNPDAIKFRPDLPHAFTREGCNMLSAVLSTPVAIKRSIQIMRAFTAMERFSEWQRADRFVVDSPDTPFLPSGLQIQQLRELYGDEATRQILQDHCGIYVGGPRSSITPVEARIIRKNNPNKRKRNEVIAALIDRGISRDVIAAISGLSRKTIYNCYVEHYGHVRQCEEEGKSYCQKKYREVKPEVQRLAQEGMKAKEIAERLKVPLATVYRWITII